MKKPLSHSRQFWCETCNQKEPLTAHQMMAHLTEVHKLVNFRGTKKTRTCIDGQGFYENTFDWILPDKVRLTEVSTGPKGR